MINPLSQLPISHGSRILATLAQVLAADPDLNAWGLSVRHAPNPETWPDLLLPAARVYGVVIGDQVVPSGENRRTVSGEIAVEWDDHRVEIAPGECGADAVSQAVQAAIYRAGTLQGAPTGLGDGGVWGVPLVSRLVEIGDVGLDTIASAGADEESYSQWLEAAMASPFAPPPIPPEIVTRVLTIRVTYEYVAARPGLHPAGFDGDNWLPL